MSTSKTTAIFSQKSYTHHKFRVFDLNLNPSGHLPFSKNKDGFSTLHNLQSFRYPIIITPCERNYSNRKMLVSVVQSTLEPDSSGSPDPDVYKWILGALLTVILPFLSNKWGPLLKFTKEVETTIETTEEVTEGVEKVAEDIEKVAEEVADKLPATGKLKAAAVLVANAAEEVAKDAQIAENIIDKVQDVLEEVDSVLEAGGVDKVKPDAREAKDEKQ